MGKNKGSIRKVFCLLGMPFPCAWILNSGMNWHSNLEGSEVPHALSTLVNVKLAAGVISHLDDIG